MPRMLLVLTLVAAAASPIFAQDDADSAETPAADESAPARPMGERGPDVPPFTIRPGYRVTRATTPGLIRDARFLAAGPKRSVFVAERQQGTIALLHDEDRDGVYDLAVTFIKDRPGVHAMQYRRGWLYFSTPTTIERARDTDGDLVADDIDIILDGLEAGGGHDWRALLVTRSFIFTALGDSGNITDETLSDRQKIWRYNLDGTGKTLWASGIRNTEELHIRPGTSELWGVDHGSDRFGQPLGESDGRQPVTDRFPADEFNRYDLGGFYGHPFLVAPRVPRYEYAQRDDILEIAAKTIPPQWLFGAHWAANGWTFISNWNQHFPPNHRGDAFVACHGSWNRTDKAGYRIERVLFDEWTGEPSGSHMIVGTLGGEDGQQVLARPVDVVEIVGGNLLFSSDAPEHVIYRIEWIASDPADQAPDAPGVPDATDAAPDEEVEVE